MNQGISLILLISCTALCFANGAERGTSCNSNSISTPAIPGLSAEEEEKGQDGNPFSAIRVEFENEVYEFTIRDALAGISIPYTVLIKEHIPAVTPKRLYGSGGPPPTSYGLHIFEELSGYPTIDDTEKDGTATGQRQYYGARRQPSGRGIDDGPFDIAVGRYLNSFEWSGLNWHGPSDTNQQPSGVFPPGEYELSIHVAGIQRIDNHEFDFKVTRKVTIRLID